MWAPLMCGPGPNHALLLQPQLRTVSFFLEKCHFILGASAWVESAVVTFKTAILQQ